MKPGGGNPAFARAHVKRSDPIRLLLLWLAMLPVLAAQQYVFHSYRQPQGLKNMSIGSLTVDHQGFLWAASENGVYRFSGTQFERYGIEAGLDDLSLRQIQTDPGGLIWVKSLKNLYVWDGARFQAAGPHPIDGESRASFAIEDRNHLFVLEKGRLFRLEHDAAGKALSYRPVFSERAEKELPQLAQLTAVVLIRAAGGEQSLWMNCGTEICSANLLPAGAVLDSDSAKITVWGAAQGVTPGVWRGFLRDSRGGMWIGGRGHIAYLAPGGSRFASRDIPGSDPQSIYAHSPLLEDREGRILAPADYGIVRWTGSAWQKIGAANGLTRANHVQGMLFDNNGDLWIGTRGEGIYNWSGYQDWEGWTTEQGLPSSSIWAIAPGRDKALIGTEDGLAWVDGKTGSARALSPASGWKFGQVAAMNFLHDGSVIAGTFAGNILRIDPHTGKTEKLLQVPSFVMSMLEDRDERLFYATKDGLYSTPPGQLHATPQPVAEANALMGSVKYVEDGCMDREGSLWFLVNNRLLRWAGNQWSVPRVEGLMNLRGDLVSMECARDGSLWLTGDESGTWRITRAGDRLHAWHLPLPAEMRDLAILDVLVDRRGWLWLGSDLGLLVWNGRIWRHLTDESGLIWNDINQSSMVEAEDGTIWIGTTGGVAHMLHPERVFDPIPLAVSISTIKRDNEVLTGQKSIVLPWSPKSLEMVISSPTIRNRSELLFRYRMFGLHSDWVEDQDGEVAFASLPPGEYIFQAKSVNPSLSAVSTTAEVHIRILAPWWRTKRFYALCFLLLLGLLALGNRLRERNLRARSRRLEKLVGERTRELEISREQLRIQATHDGLTGMMNRAAVLRALGTSMERVRREKRALVAVLVDLDHFKRINDNYGHMAGDDALRWFSAAVGAAIRPYDHAGRYGGEEFLLVLTELPMESIESRLGSLHATITNLQVRGRGYEFPMTCSMGAAVYHPDISNVGSEMLLTHADQALYEAKKRGRNRVVLHTGGAARDVATDFHTPKAEAS